jgi:hypothetical protein
MKLKFRALSFSYTLISLLSIMAYSEATGLSSEIERVRLNQDEERLYHYILEHIEHNGTSPTLKELEKLCSCSIPEELRAKLSAKSYYETGLIGALLSEDESCALAYLIRLKRGPSSLRDLVEDIHQFSESDRATTSILKNLEFLYKAGYIAVRKNGKQVYFVLPKGLKTLSTTSSVQNALTPQESEPYNFTNTFLNEETQRPVDLEVPNIVKADDEQFSPELDFDVSPRSADLPARSLASESQEMKPVESRGAPQRASESTQEAQDEKYSESRVSPSSERSGLSEIDQEAWPTPQTTIMSDKPLGPPYTSVSNEEQSAEYKGFSTEVMQERSKKLLTCAPDFWGWPYLYGQNDAEILTATSDTGSEVRIIIRNGKLVSCQPRGLLVFNEGQHSDIHFFLSERNLHQWRKDHLDKEGEQMTLPQALVWARKFLHQEQ